jgi:hypothetical protein
MTASTLTVLMHVLAAAWVFYALLFDVEMWLDSMRTFRGVIYLSKELPPDRYSCLVQQSPLFFNRLDILYSERNLLRVWMVAIQLRYVITDLIAVISNIRRGTKPNSIIKHTIWQHGIEGVICCIGKVVLYISMDFLNFNECEFVL